jgi:hypothetical protein
MAARWIILFSSPAYAIAILEWSPSAAGSVLLPTNFGFATGGLLVGVFHVKRGGSFWLYASTFFKKSRYSLTRFQTKYNFLLSLCMHPCPAIPNRKRDHTAIPYLPLSICKWPLHRCIPQLHTRPPSSFDATINSFHLHLSANHFPRFCWFLRICDWRWTLCPNAKVST